MASYRFSFYLFAPDSADKVSVPEPKTIVVHFFFGGLIDYLRVYVWEH